MQIARVLAGYSLAEADSLRKAMGKKLPAEMAKHRDRFIAGVREEGRREEDGGAALRGTGEVLRLRLQQGALDLLRPGRLLVRVAEGALSGGIPRRHPDQRAGRHGARRAIDRGVPAHEDRRPAAGHQQERARFQRRGDARRSTGDDGEPTRVVRIGLSAIKNVGVGVVDAIIAARAEQPGGRFAGLAQFCASVGGQLNRRAVECLIKVGAMRDLGNRQQLSLALDSALAAAQSTRKAAAAGQFGLFGAEIPGATDILDVPLPDVPDWSLKEQLAYEKELLGIYLSEHPLTAITNRVRGKQIVHLGTVDESLAGQRVTMIGLLIEPRAMLTKKGTMMLRATLEGVDGVSLDLIAFSEAYERCKESLIADAVVEVDVRIDLRGEQVQLLIEAVRAVRRGCRAAGCRAARGAPRAYLAAAGEQRRSRRTVSTNC